MASPDKGNDIGLFRLAKSIPFDSLLSAKKSCLPSSAEADITPAGDECIISGWGRTSETDPNDHGSVHLMEVKVGMLAEDDPTCRGETLPNYDPKNLICASQERGGSCGGDSGGVYLCPVKADASVWSSMVTSQHLPVTFFNFNLM